MLVRSVLRRIIRVVPCTAHSIAHHTFVCSIALSMLFSVSVSGPRITHLCGAAICVNTNTKSVPPVAGNAIVMVFFRKEQGEELAGLVDQGLEIWMKLSPGRHVTFSVEKLNRWVERGEERERRRRHSR